MAGSLKGGVVVQVRLAPEDIAALLQMYEMSPLGNGGPASLNNASLSLAIKWGIVAATKIIRDSGILPAYDPFRFGALVDRYQYGSKRAKMFTSNQVDEYASMLRANDAEIYMPSGFSEAIKKRFDSDGHNGMDGAAHVPMAVRPNLNAPGKVPVGLVLKRGEMQAISTRIIDSSVEVSGNLDGQELGRWWITGYAFPDRRQFPDHISDEQVWEADKWIQEKWSPNWRSIMEQKANDGTLPEAA